MIDNPAQVDRLLTLMTEALPLPAKVTPALAAVIEEQSPRTDSALPVHVVHVSDGGDHGGIVCKLDLGEEGAKAFFVSITHLIVKAPPPLAREIAAYQKHRIKRLRRFARLGMEVA